VAHKAPVKAVTTTPALLHTNVEAKEVAAKHYKLAFNDNLKHRPVWFDFSIDILYFNDNLAASCFFERFSMHADPADKPQ
jgi:2EXR family